MRFDWNKKERSGCGLRREISSPVRWPKTQKDRLEIVSSVEEERCRIENVSRRQAGEGGTTPGNRWLCSVHERRVLFFEGGSRENRLREAEDHHACP